jgi:hypothetical protein
MEEFGDGIEKTYQDLRERIFIEDKEISLCCGWSAAAQTKILARRAAPRIQKNMHIGLIR